MNDETFYVIHGWMINKLKLKTVERDVFAIIYGYSQDGESDFHGSLKYLAEMTNYTRNSICSALKSLTEKDLLIKEETEINNVKFCKYKANLYTVQAICTGVQAICTNNIINNTNKDISKDISDANSIHTIFSKSTKKQKTTNKGEYETALLLANDYSNNKVLVSELHKFIDMKHEQCGKSRYKFWASTIKNYLDELDNVFGADDKQKIEAVRLSIRYNGTTKVMVPNNYTNNNIDNVTGMNNSVRNAYENEDQSFIEGEEY